MNILMNDFRKEPKELKRDIQQAITRVLESGWYVLGPEVEKFEADWAIDCGVSHAIGVGNGLDALEISLRVSGVIAGDEVITTSMTAFATILAIMRIGAVPVLADIDPATGLLSLDSVRRCIGKKTKAIILVHLYGQIRQMRGWQSLAEEQGILLIEDCAQSHLASLNGEKAGSFGMAGAYSFYPTKNLGAMGDAGAVVTNSKSFAMEAKQFRNYGQSVRYEHPKIGINSRLDEMQAAILSVRRKWLVEFTERRRQIARYYFDKINSSKIQLLAPPEQAEAHVYHLFVILCKERDKFLAYLAHKGIQSLIHYPIPVHHQIPCSALKYDPRGMVQTERHARECLSIPCHPQMSDLEVEYVIDSINSYDAEISK